MQALGCTLKDYARLKGLPLEFLKDQGLTEITYQGSPAIRIPYRDEHGQEIAIRFRTALVKSGSADNRFRWKRGSKPCLYGLSRLQDAPATALVEGESDCHTLWYHGINAVGLPGASLWNEHRDAPHLLRYKTIFVVVEPDQGGEAMLRWIEQSAHRDRVRLVRLTGFKDPSAMHLAGPERFLERWQEALGNSAAWADRAKEQQTATQEDAWRQCQSLAKEPDILERFSSDLQRAGAVGVEREAKLLYLAVTSRVLGRVVV